MSMNSTESPALSATLFERLVIFPVKLVVSNFLKGGANFVEGPRASSFFDDRLIEAKELRFFRR
jgi:hypothetical protein